MSTADHFHSMTDDQLAEWHMVTERNTQLTNALAEEKRQRAEEKAALEKWIHEMRVAGCKSADLIIELTLKEHDQRAAARRACGQLVQCFRALRAISDAVNVDGDGTMQVLDVLAFALAVAQAREVLALYDIPF